MEIKEESQLVKEREREGEKSSILSSHSHKMTPPSLGRMFKFQAG